MSLPQDVDAEGCLVHEVHRIGAGGNIVIGEQRAARQFEVRRKTAMSLEIPLKAQRIKPHSEGCIGRLEGNEDGHCVNRIFETPAEKAWEVRTGEYPSVTQASDEDSGVAPPAAD